MLICLPQVTDIVLLLYSRPLLALCSGQAQWQLTLKFSLIRAPIHIHNRHVGPTIGSSFPVPQLKRQANHERLGCAQSSKFILFFVQY